MTDELVEPAEHAAEGPVDDLRIAAFWQAARGHVGFGKMDQVLGGSTEDVLAPPAWSFGDNPALADQLLTLVLDGRKTATSTALVELTDVGLETPRVGELSIVTDSAGEPRALLRTTQVDVVPFDRVSAEHAAAEGEDDLTLESWQAQHETYWRRVLGDDRFSTTMDVVTERFELIYPTTGPTPAVD
ncbi:ASCH domain-containing protein [Cellulomonas fengjieae]|uniref:ASCH domain-containing protein n=1 Tax=Cellulomonas fengjieae TaxID=2819978 RepID=A0ABS3SIP1_9CELL|nr:ASCH domain-containing protein [Cellulomonas fengjieae]MBO3084830.1 ASCH domain-containing protein [Cellulomonas fengjieae]QVI66855.1 ASCH domain-containing protein [Cellulomonas fengjieae]